MEISAYFPQVSGANLLRQKISLPAGLSGSYNLLFIPFQQWQQMEVNSWVPLARKLEKIYPHICYYELPTIYRMNPLAQMFINEGMRAGIPDLLSRERTITLYLEKSTFCKALAIDSEETITLLLIDKTGRILWRETGAYTAEKAAALAQVYAGLQAVPVS